MNPANQTKGESQQIQDSVTELQALWTA